MRKIFHWFYCLPISDAVLLITLATVVFLLLRKECQKANWFKFGVPALFICWMAVVFFGTLGQRAGGKNLSEPILTPFYSYYIALNGGNPELYRTNFMNAVLFYPAGLLGCALLPSHWKTVRKVVLLASVFALLSIIIEYSQYRFGLGLAEADDVIHNTLGTLLGAVACCTSRTLDKH